MKLKDIPVGVVVARFQVHKLHDGHRKLLDNVFNNHKKVIIFLGIPFIQNTKNNPLDFASRKVMIQALYPSAIILPLKDNRSDKKWSQIIDNEIKVPFGDLEAVLYGSRDSFIPHYKGVYPTTEIETDVFYSGTEARKEVSREILISEDFRAGIIHATYAMRAVTYPTVDVIAYNDDNKYLFAKKPNESNYRFIGGFVDRTDKSLEESAIREFSEETGGCEISDLKYVCSCAIDDWRYKKTDSGILTTLFIGKFIYGRIEPSDDIESLHWLDIKSITINDIVEEHKCLFTNLLNYLNL